MSITPHLWFDKHAGEAARFYTSLLPNSQVRSINTLKNTPSGDTELVSFVLGGFPFMSISAGPMFRFNPSISFLIACETKDEVDRLYKAFSDGGTDLMPLGAYPFSERFAWVQDRYGLSWQLIFAGGWKFEQKITPTLMFVGNVCGKAEEAMQFYTSVFPNSKLGNIRRHGSNEAPDREDTVTHADFTLDGTHFSAMDSAHPHQFAFNEAISFSVSCDTQDQIDYFWSKLSAVPQAEQCGWLKDKYGVSWQVVPSAMGRMLGSGDKAAIGRVTQAFLKMKKFDIAKLEEAFRG